MDEFAAELSRLRAEIAEHLAWEATLGGVGLPSASVSGVTRASAHPVPAEVASRAAASESNAAQSSAAAPAMGDKRERLSVLQTEVRGCTRCDLHRGRTQTVFSRGDPDSPLMFIGEGPGQEEDRQGVPFVGPAGQLLDKMIAAMGFASNDVYICNVVKCRPPNNRTPVPSEAQACQSYLSGQIDAVAPRVIIALGRCAAENMGLVPSGGGWRGRWGSYRGVPVMPTYHPAFLLRSPEFKRPVWEDLQQVTAKLRQG